MNAHSLAPVDPAQQEEWFLLQLELQPLPLQPLWAVLDALPAAGRLAQADSWSELLLETLAGRRQRAEAFATIARRAAWHPDTPVQRALWRKLAQGVLQDSREQQALTAHAGFEGAVPLPECFRRLRLLLALAPGVLCRDNTWGFGVVQKVDTFYGRVTIDFEKKRSHEMSLAYTAEALELLTEDHLLARQHRRPDDLRQLVQAQPAEVVRLALRSFGAMTVDQLQQRLLPGIVAAGDWKRFWDAARKGLKGDPLVYVPAKRAEQLRLLDRALARDGDWFDALAGERSVKHILDRTDELIKNAVSVTWTEGARAVVAGRLAFAAKGAGTRHLDQLARALMNAAALGLTLPADEYVPAVTAFVQPELLVKTLHALPARLVTPFLEWLGAQAGAAALDGLLAVLPRLEQAALNEALDLLLAGGREEACTRIFQRSVNMQTAGVEYLFWLFRHPERLAAWVPGTWPVLANLVVTELEKEAGGERLKAQNQLRELTEQVAWLRTVMAPMNEAQRHLFMERIKTSPAWPLVDRRGVLGRMVHLYPELAGVLVAKAAAAAAAPDRPAVTSFRTYRERQAQLQHIASVEIPRIAREIGVARSYGDLSENHEYKAAKEMQAVLARRQAELEQMLHAVRPSDFHDLPTERAGLGTRVVLRYPDGRQETFVILGEWDRDEPLGIISCHTGMARAVEGHRPGDTLLVPSEQGERSCVLAEVTGLPDAVRAWMDGADGKVRSG
ncbi:MAG: GreA/GreB family elongation factor [Kiritimatiellaeota bacterium]|nr:GreA/GreB family elongation factor [Kiritimatiellota bacterium]